MTAVVPAYGDAGRSGVYQAGGLPHRAEVAWRARTEYPAVASPLLVGDTLVVADAGGVVHAFDTTTGELRWRHNDLHREWEDDDGPVVISAPAGWNDWVFVEEGRFTGSVYVHDLRTGEVVQTIEDGGCPTVVGDIVLLHSLLKGVRALRLPGFEELWQQKPAGGFAGWIAASPAISAAGTAYAAVGFEGNHHHTGVTAFELATGEAVFLLGDEVEPCPIEVTTDDGQDRDEAPQDWVLFATTHPVVAAGLVWMMVDRGHDDEGLHVRDQPWTSAEVMGLDPASGEQRWIYRLDPRLDSQDSGSVAVADGVVYFAAYHGGEPEGDDEDVVSGEPRLHAVDIDTRQPRWTATLPDRSIGAPVLAGGVVYQATSAGTVCAFDALTGQNRWTIDLDETIVNAQDLRDEDYGYAYEEDELAVLPADAMLYIRTSRGVIALRE